MELQAGQTLMISRRDGKREVLICDEELYAGEIAILGSLPNVPQDICFSRAQMREFIESVVSEYQLKLMPDHALYSFCLMQKAKSVAV